MERIILFQTNKTTENRIRRLTSAKKISLVILERNCAAGTMAELAEGKGKGPLSALEQLPEESLMVFCDVTEKHFDKLLFEMRSKKIQIDYKAVLTPVNCHWTLPQLMRELQNERQQIQLNHAFPL